MDKIVDQRAMRTESTRSEILQYVRKFRKLTGPMLREGQGHFVTERAQGAQATLTMTFGEALQLVRVTGPIGLQNGDGSFTRLLTAMHILNKELLRAPEGRSLAVVAAIQVLQATLNDHLFACRDAVPAGWAGRRVSPPKRPVGRPPKG